MYVRISPDNGRPQDFEFDVNYSDVTDEIREAAKEAIFRATAIKPEHQNCIFLSQTHARDLRDVRKLELPAVQKAQRLESETLTKLKEKHQALFECSSIYLSRIGVWIANDLQDNRNHITVTRSVREVGTFLEGLSDRLKRPRTVGTSLLDCYPEFRDYIKQDGPRHFFDIVPSESSQASVTRTELRCYKDIFKDIYVGVTKFKLKKFDSSPMHTLFLAEMIFNPPFFWDEHHQSLDKLEMLTDFSSRLQLLLLKGNQGDVYKYEKRSDLGVVDKLSELPILICMVDSHVARRDRTRMIFQGAVACRQWQYLLPSSVKDKNRVLGLFVHDNFLVDLLMFHAEKNNHVTVYEHPFDLGLKDDALQIARILFNFRDDLLDIAGQGQEDRLNELVQLISDSKGLRSFTTKHKSKTYKSGNASHSDKHSSLSQSSQKSNNDTLLLSREVHFLLCPDKAFIQPIEHEQIASVKMLSHPSETIGFIKVLNGDELNALEVIRKSGSEFLRSRIILPTQIAKIFDCTVAFLPFGGNPLEYSWGRPDGPSGHEVKIAWDLLTIVSQLHELHIAHLDIKTMNILWDTSTHTIRVIDFDSSEIIDPEGDQKVTGVFGTSGFAAPEAESGDDIEFDPFLADAFSCGQVIRDVVCAENMSEDQVFFYDIAEEMCRENVDERWYINKAIEAWKQRVKGRGQLVANGEQSL